MARRRELRNNPSSCCLPWRAFRDGIVWLFQSAAANESGVRTMIGGNDNAAARHAIAGGYPRLILAFAILLAATGVSPAAAQDGLAKLSGKWFFD